MTNKKDQIMHAAMQLFVERGFDGTSTAAITKKAGVAAGTLFHHFENKENLIDAIYIKVKADMSDAFRDAVNHHDDVSTMFKNVWTNFMCFCVENPDSFRFADVFSNSPQISERSAEKAKAQFFDIILGLIETGKREGCLKDLPDELIFSIMSSLTVATAMYLIEHPEKCLDDGFMSSAYASCWHAISKN